MSGYTGYSNIIIKYEHYAVYTIDTNTVTN